MTVEMPNAPPVPVPFAEVSKPLSAVTAEPLTYTTRGGALQALAVPTRDVARTLDRWPLLSLVYEPWLASPLPLTVSSAKEWPGRGYPCCYMYGTAYCRPAAP